MELEQLHFHLYQPVAVKTVNRFLQDNLDSFDLVEWVLFDSHTESVYEAEVDKLYE